MWKNRCRGQFLRLIRVRQVVKKPASFSSWGIRDVRPTVISVPKEIIDKGLIGKVSLIEVCTNRNDPNGAWVYPLIDGAPDTIDWKQFEGWKNASRKYTDYMTTNNLQRYIDPDPP